VLEFGFQLHPCVYLYIIIIHNNHGSTALYGLGPPLAEVTKSCASWQLVTGRATILSIRQSGDLGEKWRHVTFLFMPVRFFYMP
jgi:hypothetical protein